MSINELTFNILTGVALEIRQAIVKYGGMANKSAVEDVMLAMFADLARDDVHEILNHCEYYMLSYKGNDPAEELLMRYAPYMPDAHIKWYRGNPLSDSFRRRMNLPNS